MKVDEFEKEYCQRYYTANIVKSKNEYIAEINYDGSQSVLNLGDTYSRSAAEVEIEKLLSSTNEPRIAEEAAYER